MRTDRVTGVVCIGLAVAFFVLAGVVRAANVDDGWANGSATVTASCLTTGVSISNKVYRSPLSLQSGDRVLSYFNVSWSDTRQAPAATATYSFHLRSAWTAEVTYQWNDWYNFTTAGGAFGSNQRSVMTDPVTAEYNIVITWEASVTVGSCVKSASDSATVVVDLP